MIQQLTLKNDSAVRKAHSCEYCHKADIDECNTSGCYQLYIFGLIFTFKLSWQDK